MKKLEGKIAARRAWERPVFVRMDAADAEMGGMGMMDDAGMDMMTSS